MKNTLVIILFVVLSYSAYGQGWKFGVVDFEGKKMEVFVEPVLDGTKIFLKNVDTQTVDKVLFHKGLNTTFIKLMDNLGVVRQEQGELINKIYVQTRLEQKNQVFAKKKEWVEQEE